MSFSGNIIVTSFLSALFFGAPAAAATGEEWEVDLTAALAKAEKSNRIVLADFTGSDWCGWCIRLEKEVFSREKFKDFAAEKVVLCAIDFPRDKSKITPEQAKKNEEYSSRYGVQGYPSIYLLEPDGSVFLKTGYREGGAESYVEFLRSVIGAREKVKAFKGKEKPDLQAAEKLLSGIPDEALVLRALVVMAAFPQDRVKERAEAAYNLIKAGRDRGGAHLGYLKEVAGRDPGNFYERIARETIMNDLNLALSRAVKILRQPPEDNAEAKIREKGERLLELTRKAETTFGEKVKGQEIYVFRAIAYRLLDDQAGVDKAWKKAVEIDPDGAILKKAKGLVRPTE